MHQTCIKIVGYYLYKNVNNLVKFNALNNILLNIENCVNNLIYFNYVRKLARLNLNDLPFY